LGSIDGINYDIIKQDSRWISPFERPLKSQLIMEIQINIINILKMQIGELHLMDWNYMVMFLAINNESSD